MSQAQAAVWNQRLPIRKQPAPPLRRGPKWPYDDRFRLVGEDVWEVDPDKAEIVELDPADVITAQEARHLLDPLIKPLPPFDEATMRPRAVAR